MTDRLSDESLLSILDAGHTNIAWLQDEPSGILAGYDLNKLCEDPMAAEIIPTIPVQSLYISLMRQGLADSIAVLPFLSADQVVRFFDYDVWRGDKPDLSRATKWLSLFREIGPEELFKRYHELDEEYQIALLYGKVRTFTDEELDNLDDGVKDELHALPCNTLFYQIMTNDMAEYECIQALIDAALAQDITYAYMLLAYCEGAVPNEAEQQLKQFRQARLEEDGFVSYAESLEIFRAVDLHAYLEKYRIARHERAKPDAGALVLAKREGDAPRNPFLTQLLQQAGEHGWSVDERYQVHQTLLYLVNGLCAIARVEPDDVAGMNRLMQQAGALVSLGVEFLASGDTDLGLLILKQEPAKNLFRVGLGLIDFTREKMLAKFAAAGLKEAEHLQKLQMQRKWGPLLQSLDASVRDLLGFTLTEILKGLFNRFPMMPVMGTDNATGKGQTISFKVIDSLAAYSQFVAKLDGVAGLIHLLQHQSALPLHQPLDKILATSFVLSALDKPCAARELSADEIDEFALFTESDLADASFHFFARVQEMLTASFFSWSVSGGYTSCQESIAHVLALFEEIVLGLSLAKAHPSHLSSLVLSTL